MRPVRNSAAESRISPDTVFLNPESMPLFFHANKILQHIIEREYN